MVSSLIAVPCAITHGHHIRRKKCSRMRCPQAQKVAGSTRQVRQVLHRSLQPGAGATDEAPYISTYCARNNNILFLASAAPSDAGSTSAVSHSEVRHPSQLHELRLRGELAEEGLLRYELHAVHVQARLQPRPRQRRPQWPCEAHPARGARFSWYRFSRPSRYEHALALALAFASSVCSTAGQRPATERRTKSSCDTAGVRQQSMPPRKQTPLTCRRPPRRRRR